MRIRDMINQDELSWCFNNFSPLLLQYTVYVRQERSICILKVIVTNNNYWVVLSLIFEEAGEMEKKMGGSNRFYNLALPSLS